MASTMQLEFSQAMSDFKKMFPEMDTDVIEVVLRANQGAVDATIDQLLAMSTDNQNERLRNELENSGTNSPSRNQISKSLQNPITSSATIQQQQQISEKQVQLVDTSDEPKNLLLLSTSPPPPPPPLQQTFGGGNIGFIIPPPITGASPKLRKTQVGLLTTTTNQHHQLLPDISNGKSKWNPPLLGPLPPTFLRLTGIENRTDFDLPDEQFALMLQNEEFMNELRWNQEFMSALEKEQQDKSGDDVAFKERVRHMGKVSRKKFLQVARVFTWQRNKKSATSAKQIDSLPLKEEHSDDDEHHHGSTKK